MAKGKLRIAAVGVGQRLAHLISILAQSQGSCTVVGYVDPSPVGAPWLEARGVSLGPGYASVSELLQHAECDLVMIGSPNHLHVEQLREALPFGRPIFIEKPVARTVEETFALARLLSERAAPPIYVGLVLRRMPIVEKVVSLVEQGALGRLISIDATEHLSLEHGGYLARNWRRREEFGGSFLLDKVCHDFDVFAHLIRARPRAVASFGGRAVFGGVQPDGAGRYSDGRPAYVRWGGGWSKAARPFGNDMDVADHQVAIVQYENGVNLAFHCNSHSALPERRWNLVGDKGALVADLVSNQLWVRGAFEAEPPRFLDFGTDEASSHNGADEAMMESLLASVRHGAVFPVTVAEALEAGLAVMAIDQAMATGAVVDCTPLYAEFDHPVGAGRRAG